MLFALRNIKTQKLMGFYAGSNGGDFCSEVVYSLTTSCLGGIWVVNDRRIAEQAAITDTPGYNADFETPMNDYVGQLEVVELEIKS